MFCTLLAKTTKQINVISHSWIVYPENGRDSWSRKKSNEEGNRLIKSNQDFTGFYNNTLQHKLPLSFCDIVSARSSMMTTSESVPAALFTVAESSVKKTNHQIQFNCLGTDHKITMPTKPDGKVLKNRFQRNCTRKKAKGSLLHRQHIPIHTNE